MIREWNSSRKREFFYFYPKSGTLKEKDGGAKGPIAHPVERIICNDEVSGSSPLGSTGGRYMSNEVIRNRETFETALIALVCASRNDSRTT